MATPCFTTANVELPPALAGVLREALRSFFDALRSSKLPRSSSAAFAVRAGAQPGRY